MENTNDSAKTTLVTELYPELPAAKREEAEYYLDRYLDLIERIHDRLNS